MTKDGSDNLRFSTRTNTVIELIASTCDVEKNDGRFVFDVYASQSVNVLTMRSNIGPTERMGWLYRFQVPLQMNECELMKFSLLEIFKTVYRIIRIESFQM